MSLHSRYDPLREAERYIDAVGIAFKPFCIVVSEPGDSWLARVLRNRYPDALLVALRYDPVQFVDSDSLWDAVWRSDQTQNPENFLFSLIPDEYLPLTVFVPWKPADAMWPAQAERVWKGIASLIRLQKDVMYTRTKFGRRWLGNMVRNFMLAGHAAALHRINDPVFLALSGPSLESQFPLECSGLFVCAASSSISALHARGCRPDLCLATDGGFWALPLFRDMEPGIPVAFPLEAAIPSRVLADHPSVFLSYGSAIEKDFFSMLGIEPDQALRNGTVAGTALQYLLSRSSGRLYVAGLDLQNTASFSHARPHESLETLDAQKNRLNPESTALFLRNLDSGPLETYARWFSSHQSLFEGRVFRLRPEGRPLDGFPAADIREVEHGSGMAVETKPDGSATRALCLPDISVRRKLLSEYLRHFRETLRVCRDEKDNSRKNPLFSDVMTGETACAELLQFVSYTDYINALKSVRMDEETGANAIDRLCDQALAGISFIAEKVASYD